MITLQEVIGPMMEQHLVALANNLENEQMLLKAIKEGRAKLIRWDEEGIEIQVEG